MTKNVNIIIKRVLVMHGEYISGQSLGRPIGAKGVEIDPVYVYAVSENAANIISKRKSLSIEAEKMAAGDDWSPVWYEGGEDNEEIGMAIDAAKNELLSTGNWYKIIPLYTTAESVSANDIIVENPPRDVFYSYSETILTSDQDATSLICEAEKKEAEKQLRLQKELEYLSLLVQEFKKVCKLENVLLIVEAEGRTSQRIYIIYDGVKYEVRGYAVDQSQFAIQEIKKKHDEKKLSVKRIEAERQNKLLEIKAGKNLAIIDGVYYSLNDNGELYVPQWAIPHLIGRGGENIKGFFRRSGIRVKLVAVNTEQQSRKSRASWTY